MFRKRKTHHLTTGKRGEQIAAIYLLLRGYRILERNYLCPPGEIDIIARKSGIIVFIEVRTRRKGAHVNPIESIDNLKLGHIVEAAHYFLTARAKRSIFCRFDIISVRANGPLRGRIQHYIDAFRTTDERAGTARRRLAALRQRPRF